MVQVTQSTLRVLHGKDQCDACEHKKSDEAALGGVGLDLFGATLLAATPADAEATGDDWTEQ